MDIELTDEERKAIARLKRLAKQWPESLWLFADGSALSVMQRNDDDKRAYLGNETDHRGQSVDPDYMVDFVNIPNDGGDW